ncbi:MAG: hypothetical protein GDA51_11780 [Ekhidna sp.]|nr:hypothetical protein [Ekhidna sp.]MBC6427114.1 hypothetical protein [Ekhidna sp.]
MILILSMLSFAIGCSKEEPKQQLDTTSIYGTWQLVESGIGLPHLGGGSYSETNGYKISFFQDLKFSSKCSESEEVLDSGSIVGVCTNSNGENMSGEYLIIDHERSITLIFDKIVDGFAGDNFAKKRTYQFRFEDQYLLLTNNLCDEGCYDKLEKTQITNE